MKFGLRGALKKLDIVQNSGVRMWRLRTDDKLMPILRDGASNASRYDEISANVIWIRRMGENESGQIVL